MEGDTVKAIHYINSGLWLCNAATWALYAGSLPMGIASLAAAIGAVVIARRSDDWRY
jgi:hypothetical protein